MTNGWPSQHEHARRLLQGATIEGVEHFISQRDGIDRLKLTLASGEVVTVEATTMAGQPALDFHVETPR